MPGSIKPGAAPVVPSGHQPGLRHPGSHPRCPRRMLGRPPALPSSKPIRVDHGGEVQCRAPRSPGGRDRQGRCRQGQAGTGSSFLALSGSQSIWGISWDLRPHLQSRVSVCKVNYRRHKTMRAVSWGGGWHLQPTPPSSPSQGKAGTRSQAPLRALSEVPRSSFHFASLLPALRGIAPWLGGCPMTSSSAITPSRCSPAACGYGHSWQRAPSPGKPGCGHAGCSARTGILGPRWGRNKPAQTKCLKKTAIEGNRPWETTPRPAAIWAG